MSRFNLQQWLDQQREYNALRQTGELGGLQEVEVGGFGFPHYAEFDAPDFGSPAINHFLHL